MAERELELNIEGIADDDKRQKFQKIPSFG